MTAITLMAIALQRELFDRRELFNFGLNTLPIDDCEAIIKAVLEKSASAAESARLSAGNHDGPKHGT